MSNENNYKTVTYTVAIEVVITALKIYYINILKVSLQ